MASEDKKCFTCDRPSKEMLEGFSPLTKQLELYCRECTYLEAYSFAALCAASNNGKAESFPDTPNATTYHKKEYKSFRLAVEEEFPVADFPEGVPDYVVVEPKPVEPKPEPPRIEAGPVPPEVTPSRNARRTR